MMASARRLPPPDLSPRPTGRWWKYVGVRQLVCPRGHHIPANAKVHETGCIPCRHWIASERRECDAWVFVFAIRGGGCIIAEVSLDEQDEMAELQTPAAMLTYLGIFS